ncbi:MAG: helix-turn-helix domain-containing protein [Pseudomonadota bacterium]
MSAIDEYIFKDEIAAELHITRRTLDKMIRRGEIGPFLKFGGREIMERRAFAEWLRNLPISKPYPRVTAYA